jgi:hypothetical protein
MVAAQMRKITLLSSNYLARRVKKLSIVGKAIECFPNKATLL